MFFNIVTLKVLCPVMTKSSFIAVKVETFSVAHSRIFKDRNLTSRTFQGLGFSFANSRTFQDFQGPWQPCDGLRATMVTKIQRKQNVVDRLACEQARLRENWGKAPHSPSARFASATYFFFARTLSPNPQGEPAHMLQVIQTGW